jgi:type II secretory pathway pseudopilin PulG
MLFIVRFSVTEGAFTLVELSVSMGVLAVVLLSLVKLLNTAIENNNNARLKICQQMTLNTLVTSFQTDAEAAISVAWDHSAHQWIVFENAISVVRYSFEIDSKNDAHHLFYREVYEKESPLPNLLSSNAAMPTAWASTYDTRHDARDVMPEAYAMNQTFTCAAPCFDFQDDYRVLWSQPRIEDDGDNDLITQVFGEQGYQVQDIVVLKTMTLPLL